MAVRLYVPQLQCLPWRNKGTGAVAGIMIITPFGECRGMNLHRESEKIKAVKISRKKVRRCILWNSYWISWDVRTNLWWTSFGNLHGGFRVCLCRTRFDGSLREAVDRSRFWIYICLSPVAVAVAVACLADLDWFWICEGLFHFASCMRRTSTCVPKHHAQHMWHVHTCMSHVSTCMWHVCTWHACTNTATEFTPTLVFSWRHWRQIWDSYGRPFHRH